MEPDLGRCGSVPPSLPVCAPRWWSGAAPPSAGGRGSCCLGAAPAPRLPTRWACTASISLHTGNLFIFPETLWMYLLLFVCFFFLLTVNCFLLNLFLLRWETVLHKNACHGVLWITFNMVIMTSIPGEFKSGHRRHCCAQLLMFPPEQGGKGT